MSTVRSLREGSWKEQHLHPKSIAHLLHWDLAYLWVLAREPQFRPDHWVDRVATWERLLGLFLAGRLKIHRSPIERPLLNYTQRFGIKEVRLLHLRGQNHDSPDPCGLVSPIVLVRPFPDTNENRLPELPEVDWQDGRLQHCLGLLLAEFDRTMDPATAPLAERSIQNQLRTVLRRYRRGVATPCPAGTTRVPIHRAISFAPDTAAVADELVVSFVSEGAPQYVPYCDYPGCGIALTFPENAAPWQVVNDFVSLTCRNGHAQRIPLENLYVWRRPLGDMHEFVCWSDAATSMDHLAAGQQALLPPSAAIEDGQIVFRWNPGFVGGDPVNVTLRIQTGGYPIRAASFRDDALYSRLLVPGQESASPGGLPIRFEWRNAWLDHQSTALPGGILFTNVRIAGRRYPVRMTYEGSAWVDRIPDLFLGVYPKRMHALWKPYRVAVLGEREQQFRIKAIGAYGGVSWVQDVQGWPQFCSVERSDQSAGATYDLRAIDAAADPAVGAQRTVGIGIDFGTSNSVVYFADDQTTQPTTERSGIHLNQYASLMEWISPAPPQGWRTWLYACPPAAMSDPYLIPTTLWKTASSAGYIRWGQSPLENIEQVHAFKWDAGIRDYTADRRRFLEELLFLSIPVMLSRLGARRARPSLKIGFSYPLAFSDAQRSGFRSLLRHVENWCDGQLGYPCSTTSINESLASVKASVGLPQTKDLFLVADMGGRTLDVVLFSYPDNIHQIGSLDFGGEVLLEKVAARKAGASSGDHFEREYWRIRDSIQGSDSVARPTGDSELRQRVERFHVMALEFLRTMLLRQRQSGLGNVELVLIGNGWRLQDLLAGNRDPARHLLEYSTLMVDCFHVPDVSVLSTGTSHIHSPKHWVAVGALRWALGDSFAELDRPEAYPSRLPAGRRTTINNVNVTWDELVGEGGVQRPQWLNAPNYDIDVDFPTEPGMTPEWVAQLDRAIPPAIRYPKVAQLAESLKNTIRLGRLGRGAAPTPARDALEKRGPVNRLLLLLIPVTGAFAQCKLPPLVGSAVFPGSAVRWCPPTEPFGARGNAAVLIDDSASMTGFGKSAIARFGFWMNQSLSQVRQRGVHWVETRGCYFSTGRPLANCRATQITPEEFHGARDTTLHEAIAYAGGFQLAVILTDGSSAAGQNSGDCASSVDAACIARALATTLQPLAGENKDVLPGIWIVPLIADYSGRFFAEQPIAPDGFDVNNAIANSTRESRTQTAVTDPARGYRGLLEYKYTGPRALFALILSRNVQLGRAMAAAMMSRRSFSQIGFARTWRDFSGGLAALNPIEVFPGIVPRVEWSSAVGAERACRTLDVGLHPGTELAIACPNEVDRTVVTLRARAEAAGSECVVIHNLPAMTVKARTTMPPAAIEDFRWSGSLTDVSAPLTVQLQLQCRKAWHFSAWLAWASTRDFRASSARMAANRAIFPAEEAVFTLSASEVAYHPNRIFQLRELLEKLYRNVLNAAPSEAAEFGRIAVTKP